MASSLSFGQLQNGNFENWDTLSIKDPSGWLTSNINAVKHGSGPNVTQYTPAYGGNYAIKLKTIANPTDTVFGLFTNSSNPMQTVGGMPYTA